MATGTIAARPAAPTPKKRPSRRQAHQNPVVINVGRVLLVAALLGLWELLAARQIVDPFFISRPSEVAGRLWSWSTNGRIFEEVWPTLLEAAAGLGISAAVGIVCGILLSEMRFLEVLLRPLLDVFNTLPRIALAPLFVLWFGLGYESKVLLVVSVVTFPFMINTYSGMTSVDPEFVRMARSLGATRRSLLRTVIFPSIVPWLFAAVRFGVAYSFATAVVAEMVSANQGLGFLIAYSSGILDTAGLFAAIVVLAALAWFFNATFAALERRLLRWKETNDVVAVNV